MPLMSSIVSDGLAVWLYKCMIGPQNPRTLSVGHSSIVYQISVRLQ